jgi:hypothetical protein
MTFRSLPIANASRCAHLCAWMRASSIGSTGGAGIDRAILHVLK